MDGLNGFMLPDGGVCYTGPAVEERHTASEAARPGAWPWSGPVMQGDSRAAIAWPDRGVPGGTVSARGSLAIAVIDPDGLMRIVSMQEFDRVSTGVDDSGKMREGLGLMLRDLVAWGVHDIGFQYDDSKDSETWWGLIKKDPALQGVGHIPCNVVDDIPRVCTILREMGGNIIIPREQAAKIEQANARGDVLPMTKAVGMLAYSYKFHMASRIKPGDFRWEAWK